MTSLSNDIKWNKLQAIQKLLYPLIKTEYFSNYVAGKSISPSKAKAIWKLNTWELSNKLYNIATEGFYEEDSYPYSIEPQSWADYVADCNRLALDDWGRSHNSFVRSNMEEYKDEYEYSNS